MFHIGVGRVGFSEGETNKIKQEISEYLCVCLYNGIGGWMDTFIIHVITAIQNQNKMILIDSNQKI